MFVVYVAVRLFFPFFNNRSPLVIALFVTYWVTAYIFIPLIVRVYRVFARPNHIPLYCVTPDGFASDPINIGLIGTKRQVMQAMEAAGWHKADPRTPQTLYRMIRSILIRRPYLNAPFSNLYLFGRRQDLGYQKPIKGSVSHRHHVRLWACHLEGPEAFHEHVEFWQNFHRPGKKFGRQLWVGAASRDMGIMPIRHNMQLTHMVDPDTDSERDLIVSDLRAAHEVQKTLTEHVHQGFSLTNRVFGGVLHADGKIRICIIK